MNIDIIVISIFLIISVMIYIGYKKEYFILGIKKGNRKGYRKKSSRFSKKSYYR
uniref:Uncharacterized protein n=1 Tax=viral metagenome TaxID=1070528 RepID=A0A6C0IZI9_9ZZZZ